MKKLLIIAALLAATSAPASAQLSSDVSTIFAGQSITFNYTIPPGAIAPPSISGPFPFGGGITYTDMTTLQFIGSAFNSGDGQTQVGGGTGPATFTYLTPGDYVAFVSVEIDYVTTVCYSVGGCLNVPGS